MYSEKDLKAELQAKTSYHWVINVFLTYGGWVVLELADRKLKQPEHGQEPTLLATQPGAPSARKTLPQPLPH